jgi:D-alanine-D-alanine ligase
VQGRTQVVVLFGGRSAEHDVSRVTAAEVTAALDPDHFDITTIGIDRQGSWWRVDPVPGADGGLTVAGEPWSIGELPAHSTDRMVVLPLLHGPLGEDGTVQGLLEILDVAYVGSGVLSSSVCMDKAMTKSVLSGVGIPQVRYRALRQSQVSPEVLEAVVAELGLPAFVKPANMGSSVGVTKAHDWAELCEAVDNALRFDEWILVEEAVLAREIEVAVLGDLEPRASVPGEIVPCHEFYDYADKYLGGGAELRVPAPLTPAVADEARALSLRIFDTLRCSGMARVDFLYEEHGRGLLCSEVNTIPGFTPVSMYPKLWQATGLTYSGLLGELIDLALQRHSRRRRTTDRA